MNNFEDLEEANKRIEKSKVDFHNKDNSGQNKNEQAQETGAEENQTKEGSGIFTADGEELPKVDGGYDLIEPGGTLGDDEFVSV